MIMKINTQSLSKYKYLIVDDHALFREGLHRILKDAGINDIAEASSGEEALIMTEHLKPDIILMDLYMKGINGIETTRRILSKFPTIGIIILTVDDDDKVIAEALRAGAQGFLNKNMYSKDIINSLVQLIMGKIPLAKPISRAMLNELTTTTDFSEPYFKKTSPFNPQILSPREKEILSALALGKSNKEIARDLFISENTVKNHVRNILNKFEVNSRTQAVTKAMVLGLLNIPKIS